MAEPVSVDTARARLGLASDHRDAEIGMLITAARRQVETLSGLTLVRRERLEELSAFPGSGGFALATWPVKALVSVAYVDAEGVAQTIANGRVIAGVRRVHLWPVVGGAWPYAAGGIVVRLDAGFDGTVGDPYPAELVQALLALVGCWFEDHEGKRAIPQIVKDLCFPFRRNLV